MFYMDLFLLLLATGILLLFGVHLHYTFQERKDMLDRLMAKSLPEFKDNQVVEPNQIEEPETEEVPIEYAREDIVNG